MNYILFDDNTRVDLLPFTFTRPVADIRIGILTIREKWERYLNSSSSSLTEDYLQIKYPLKTTQDNIWIAGSVCPNEELVKNILSLEVNQILEVNDVLVAAHTGNDDSFNYKELDRFEKVNINVSLIQIANPWDIFAKNELALKHDFELITANRRSQPISESNKVIAPENIFIEEGAKVECAILNASTGPIYIGKDAEIMEGAIVRGPFSLGEHSTLKLGSKIYGATTIGPHCKVGGEVSNSVIMGYSNKGHDGFLGNSVLGEWCNIGADSNNSNLKNNYGSVNLWNYSEQCFTNTNLTFCGLMMGDHSKCGINTMFNTGTIVGVNANVFGSDFIQKFVPSFSWGGSNGFIEYKYKDAINVAKKVFERRSKNFDQVEEAILAKVFELTDTYRK